MTYGLVWLPYVGGWPNPYYGGFGHFNLPASGFGWLYPGFSFPFIGGDSIPPGL